MASFAAALKTVARCPGRLLLPGVFRVLFFMSLINGMAEFVYPATDAIEEEEPLVGFGFSKAMFSGVHENDALASIKIWVKAVAKELDLPISPEPIIFQNEDEIVSAVKNKYVEGLFLTTWEYANIKDNFISRELMVGTRSGNPRDEYLLIVNKDSGYNTPEDLRQKTLGMMQGNWAALMPIWLENFLAESNLPSAQRFLKIVSFSSRPDKLIYKLFFNQIDACIVTRGAFDLISELNPQIKDRVNVLTSSAPVVASLFIFRGDSNRPLIQRILSELTQCHTTPSGKQLLTFFKVETLIVEPITLLDTSLDIIQNYKRRHGGSGGDGARTPDILKMSLE